MSVASQDGRAPQRARTRAALIAGALDVLRVGRIPSVADAAQASGVSRATAYRYFSDASTLLNAVLRETVTPLRWEAVQETASDDPAARVSLFLDEALPIMRNGDAQLRAALRVALDQKASERSDTVYKDSPVERGTRLRYVEQVLAPIRDDLTAREWRTVTAAVAMIVGIEAQIVLHDLCELTDAEADEVIRWSARMLVGAAISGVANRDRDGRRRPTQSK